MVSSNDIHGHMRLYQNWKKQVVDSDGKPLPNYLEKDLSKKNSHYFIQYILDMELGMNVSKNSKKGGRSPKTLNRLRSKIKSIFKGLEAKGYKDVTKLTGKQVLTYFKDLSDKGYSTDYATRFKSFWNWWMTKNRRENGVVLPDICEDLSTTRSNDSKFVWLEKKDFEDFRAHFTEEEQELLTFVYDTIIRAPGELSGVLVGDIFMKPNNEIWVNIREEISKTFGRKFNLVYCGEAIWKRVKDKDPDEPLFQFSSPYLNRKMQKVAKQLWKEKVSLGGEKFSNITIYDLRHSGAIHYRQLFQKTGQSLDSLRHRGGWTDYRMINYYTKLLGLDGHIDKNKTLLQEDKTALEKEVAQNKDQIERLISHEEKVMKAHKNSHEVLKKLIQLSGEGKIKEEDLSELLTIYNKK